MRILLVEDDFHMAATVADGLRRRHVEVVVATSYREGSERAALGSYAAILLDVALPDGSGLELCRRLREEGVQTPILMLTALGTVEDKVTGLEAGADDYLPKPFAFRELFARIEALTRRQPSIAPRKRRIADLEVDVRARAVTRAGLDLALTAKEFDLLEFLVRHEGEVKSRAEITAYVWDDNHDPRANALEVLVRRLRMKVDEPFDPKLIHTIRGSGYRCGLS